MKKLLPLLFVALVAFSCSTQNEQSFSVDIYGSNTCHHCTDFKKALDSVGWAYNFHDVDVDDKKMLEMWKLIQKYRYRGPSLFPVVHLNQDTLIVGAKFSKFQKVIEKLD